MITQRTRVPKFIQRPFQLVNVINYYVCVSSELDGLLYSFFSPFNIICSVLLCRLFNGLIKAFEWIIYKVALPVQVTQCSAITAALYGRRISTCYCPSLLSFFHYALDIKSISEEPNATITTFWKIMWLMLQYVRL